MIRWTELSDSMNSDLPDPEGPTMTRNSGGPGSRLAMTAAQMTSTASVEGRLSQLLNVERMVSIVMAEIRRRVCRVGFGVGRTFGQH